MSEQCKTFYHGSTHDRVEAVINKVQPLFGTYNPLQKEFSGNLTDDSWTAMQFAFRTMTLHGGIPVVLTYQIPDSEYVDYGPISLFESHGFGTTHYCEDGINSLPINVSNFLPMSRNYYERHPEILFYFVPQDYLINWE